MTSSGGLGVEAAHFEMGVYTGVIEGRLQGCGGQSPEKKISRVPVDSVQKIDWYSEKKLEF